jgi:hypothetical protein
MCLPPLRAVGAAVRCQHHAHLKKFTDALHTHHQLKPARETQQQQLNAP